MKTETSKLTVSRLIQTGIFCGLLLCSLALSANDFHSVNDKTKTTKISSERSENELPHQSTWDTVVEEEDIKLESWMYNTDDPLWQTVIKAKEKESSDEEVRVEAWMFDPSSWTKI